MNKKGKKLIPSQRFPEFFQTGDWRMAPLGVLCDVLNNRRRPITSSDRDRGDYPYYGASGIVDYVDSYIFDERLVLVGEDGAKWGAYEKTAFIVEGKYWVNNHAHVLKATAINDSLLENFLVKLDLGPFVTGAAPPKLTLGKLKEIPIPVPPTIQEQQKIADCLSSVDELIAAECKKLDALKNHKKGLIQELLPAEGEGAPKLRFSDFKNAAPWKKIKLIDVTDRAKKWGFIGGPFGSNLKASDYVEDGVRVIQLQNISDGEFINDYQIFTSEEKANELLSNNIYPGEIIMSKMGDPVGRACYIPSTHPRYVMCSDGIRLVVDEQKHSKYFIYSLINSSQFRASIEKTATGSTRKRIGLDDLKNLPMLVPDKGEQEKISNLLSSIDELIAAQDNEIRVLKSHKKSLMQQLFPLVDGVGV